MKSQFDDGGRTGLSVEVALDRALREYSRAIVIIDRMWLLVARVSSEDVDIYYVFNSHGVDEIGRFGKGNVARSFRCLSLAGAAVIIWNGILNYGRWDGNFSIHGVDVKVLSDASKAS